MVATRRKLKLQWLRLDWMRTWPLSMARLSRMTHPILTSYFVRYCVHFIVIAHPSSLPSSLPL